MDDDPPYQLNFVHLRHGAEDTEVTLHRAIEATLRHESVACARLSVAIVSDDEIARLNQQYLNHKGPTDVLSFDLSDDEDGHIDGELILSLDTATREAVRRGHSLEAELALYLAHGLLHLIGYDDATEPDASRMHTIEDEILTSVGLGNVYDDQ